MQRSIYTQRLTPLQSLIFQLFQEKYSKVDQTFYALPIDLQIAQRNQRQIQDRNTYFMENFGIICLGKQKHKETGGFVLIKVESAILYVKEIQINKKLIRLVYFPLIKWDLTGDKGPIQYKKMVIQQTLFTHFLKPTLTAKHTLISVSHMLPGQADIGQDLPVIKINDQIKKILQELGKIFKLDASEVRLKLIFAICIRVRREDILFSGEINRKIYILTSENHSCPLFALNPTQQENFGLKNEPTDLLSQNNYVTVPELYKHFSYNQFFHFKPTRPAEKSLGLNISDEIWAIFLAIINPIYQIKQIIHKEYFLQEVQVQGEDQPVPYPDASLWKSNYEIRADYHTLNQIFKFEEWKERQNETMNDLAEENVIRPERPDEKRIVRFTQMFNLNTEFLHDQPKFIHAMILTQINNLHKQLEEQNRCFQSVESDSEHTKKFLFEKKILEFGKIIVRLLGSLKNSKHFNHLLANFETKFYEHLLTIYGNAHDEFCRASKATFNKLFDLVQKVRNLKSVKPQLLKILKFKENGIRWQKSRKDSLEQAKRKKKKLQILLKLLLENQTNNVDRQIKKKIYVVKFDLAITLKKLAFELDFGNKNSKYLKEALKIVFVDLYKNLFHENNNLSTEYSTDIGFSDDILLQEASTLLKMMGRIDLSIELQKKMGKHKIVAEYYKYWLMSFRIELQNDLPLMRKIINSAITYFKAKHHTKHVSDFYDLLVETGKTKMDRDNFDKERLDYEAEIGDPVYRRRIVQAARIKAFPLVDNSGNNNKDTVQDIVSICMPNEERNNMNSLIFQQ